MDRINNLKKKLYELKKDVYELTANRSEIFTRYNKALLNAQDRNRKKLEMWKKNEISYAKKTYEGQIYSSDCDFVNDFEAMKKRRADFILVCADRLCNEFPDAFKYFSSQGYKFAFNKILKSSTNAREPVVIALETTQSLIPKELIDEDLAKFENTPQLALDPSAQISVQIGENPEIKGKIRNIPQHSLALSIDDSDINVEMSMDLLKYPSFKVKV